MTVKYFEMAEARRDGHRNIGEAARASGVSAKSSARIAVRTSETRQRSLRGSVPSFAS